MKHLLNHVCLFILLALSIAGTFLTVDVESQTLAQKAAAILQHTCDTCHGDEGSFRTILDIEYTALMESGTVVPGDPDASELYKRLLGPTDQGGQMPQGQDPLPPEQIAVIRDWIAGGARNWATTEADRFFISQEKILDTIRNHVETLPLSDQPFARYFSMTHLYNAGVPENILTEYRRALSKLVNSLSWGSTIFNPQPIDTNETIFYIDVRYYEWEHSNAWTHIEQGYPYQPDHASLDDFYAEIEPIRENVEKLQSYLKCKVPHIFIDWFIANASLPPLYNTILNLPETVRELETKLNVDAAENIINAPGRRVWRAGFNDSGVSSNNRVVERHAALYGAYWKSYDFAASVGRQNIYLYPTAFVHDGGEMIFNLPNGLQAYYLADAVGNQLDIAPIEIVSNPAASDPQVKNGLSCIGCHDKGMKEFTDTVRQAIINTPNPLYDKEHALRLYAEQSTMDTLIAQDTQRYENALTQTGNIIGGIEPVQRLHEAYHKRIDVAYAAASLGLQKETFLLKIKESPDLQALGLQVFSTAGTLKRDTWVSNFHSYFYAIYPPIQPPITEPPIEEPQLDGIVNIPDPVLRAAISKTLIKPIEEPITVSDMESLESIRVTSSYEQPGTLQDLTGLEYAINLIHLDISGNNVSDLTPIANLTKLAKLYFDNNKVVDITPLAKLKNLVKIYMNDNKGITDYSVYAKLTNLRRLNMWGAPNFSDISDLVNLPNIEAINVCGTSVSQIPPLDNAKTLKDLYIFISQISDISSLSTATHLERLHVGTNLITDVTPLANLTNLKWLNVAGNPIIDFTPLYELSKNTKILPSGFRFTSDAKMFFQPNDSWPWSSVIVGSTFTLNIEAIFIKDLAGWGCDITFNPDILEVLEVAEGSFLSEDGQSTFFMEGTIDNENGILHGYSVLRLDGRTLNGNGTLLSIKFKTKQIGRVEFGQNNCIMGNSAGEEIQDDIVSIKIEVLAEEEPEEPEEPFTGSAADVNKDGNINILDLIVVANNIGKSIDDATPRSDVNGDGVINILDLTEVVGEISFN